MLQELERLDDFVDYAASYMWSDEYRPAEYALANIKSFVRHVSEPETERILKSEIFAIDVETLLNKSRDDDPEFNSHTRRLVR